MGRRAGFPGEKGTLSCEKRGKMEDMRADRRSPAPFPDFSPEVVCDVLTFHIVTLFPDFFGSALRAGLMGRAIAAGTIAVDFHDPREFSTDRHRHVDDRPYGGGPGMLMQTAPVAAALRSLERPGRMLAMAPNGRAADQKLMRELSLEGDITLLCGRYEGFDARLYGLFPLESVSVGDIVLNGGETAALAIMEAVSRLVPGFMGREASGDEESFSAGLLEYPHYTRPPVLEGHPVPEILESGDHGAIAAWRRGEALATTLARRPDLLEGAPLTKKDGELLATFTRPSCARSISFCLVHSPVVLAGHRTGMSSVTNLDLHDISRTARTYGMGTFYVATPAADQRALLTGIIRHWERAGVMGHENRLQALRMACPVESVEEAVSRMTESYGEEPFVIATTANWPKKPACVSFRDVRAMARKRPVLILLGTAHGLSPKLVKACGAVLRPVRFMDYNHLSVRSAAAIIADRIIGDFY